MFTDDPDFETELYAAYGEPQEDDHGVTERLLRRLNSGQWIRVCVLATAGLVGAVFGVVALALGARSLMVQLQTAAGAPAPVVWFAVGMAALLIGAAVARLADNN